MYKQTKIVKTYACKIEIIISKPVIIKIMINGNKLPKIHNVFLNIIIQVNKDNIFKSVWPDIILANNLIAKLNTLAKYEINSITIKKGPIINGTPLGKNNWKKLIFNFLIPIIFIPINKDKDKENVNNKWLVIVKV